MLFITVVQAREVIGMVFEYASGGELYTRMKKSHKMSENVAKFYFCEIAHALGYLHSLKIIYRFSRILLCF